MGGLPPEQAIEAFASDPTEHPVMFAATSQALWKSQDRGTTWQPLDKAPTGVTAIGIHPRTPDRVFAGTGDGLIFGSADRGASWQRAP